MAGEGAKYSPFARLINVVLSFQPKRERFRATESLQNVFDGTPEAVEYGRAVRIAGLKAAVHLAEVTKGHEPDHVETYALTKEAKERLPRVVYLFQGSSPYVYGAIVPGTGAAAGPLPTIIHPNEILDGALVNSGTRIACMREATYLMQNHAVIHKLYEDHGKDLDFLGVIFYTNGKNLKTKDRLSSYAANLAILLRAEGAILNYLGGGHPIVDVMMTCEKLEKRGVKTTLLLMEMAANPEDSGHVHFVREADAIVSTGNYEQALALEAMPKVLGGTRILESGSDASGPLSVNLRQILGSTHQFGGSYLRGQVY
jgi:glycine reductase